MLLAVLMIMSILPISALAEGEAPMDGPVLSTDSTDTTDETGATEPADTQNLTADPDTAEPTTEQPATETPTSAQPADDVVLVDRTAPEDAVKYNDDLYLTGMMPTDAVVDVQPVDVDINGTSALLAYDITLYADADQQKEGNEWQPDGDSITVSLLVEHKVEKVDVYHLSDVDATPEYVGTFPVVDGRVEFEATGFSVYAIIDHEEGTVNAPRVEFHFIKPSFDPALMDGSTAYYAVAPYEFKNKHNDTQTTQIIKNGESLELITDPGNQTSAFFYGWYVVSPYVCSETDAFGVGTNGNLYYTWPGNPGRISFETPISIAESGVQIGDTVNWSLGDASGSGIVDGDGNLHVFLAPVYEKYNFINFMLYSRSSPVNNLMTRKLVAVGSSDTVEVRISDVRSTSKDSVHLVFAGWEYNNGTEWVKVPTVDHFGDEIKDPGKDGVYLSADLADTSGIDLYPLFVEARWIDFVSGLSGSGAAFVGSRYLEAWGAATPAQTPEIEGENIATTLPVSTRAGYDFDGWYAFALLDQNTGEITNLTTPADVTVTYIDSDYNSHTVTINTTAIPITDGSGSIIYDGTYTLPISATENEDLFSAENGKLKLHEALDRLALTAKWTPANTVLTIAYWTENALDDEYESNAIRALTTAQLTAALGRPITSGSVITLEELKTALDPVFGVALANNDILDDVGAVAKKTDLSALTPKEDIFYDLNETLSTPSVTISGDGETIFNIYFSRKVFKLVFHIGRDGYYKNAGNPRPNTPDNDLPSKPWNPSGNWIQFMYNDTALTNLLGRAGNGSASYSGIVSMTYTPENKTATSAYVTTLENIMGDYVPDPTADTNDENLYIIEAKYGAYIGDRWPTPTNPNFTFVDATTAKTMYTWSGFWGSLYCKIANSRTTTGNPQGANPDINGIYEYMTGELCSDRTGNNLINANQVHHLVAYYGEGSTGQSQYSRRDKRYHTIFEAIDGTYDPSIATLQFHPGTDYSEYPLTTWSQANNHSANNILGHTFFEDTATSPSHVISNLEPQYQMGWEYDGYEYIYSCYEPTKQSDGYHIYFFYRPKVYTLTFMHEDSTEQHSDPYYYKQSLANAKKHENPEKPGYVFLGWYTNEAGAGDPFDFANETMPSRNVVLYPVFKKLNYIIRIDPNGAEIDHWRATSSSSGASTGFRADYNETISSYDFLSREYIPTDDAEIAALGLNANTEVFYYYKTRYRTETLDGRYIPSGLRDALYLTASQIDDYWAHYQSIPESAFTTRGAEKFAANEKDEWMDTYFGGHDLSTLQKYRELRGAEHYTFMGWYQVIDGKVSSVPFNFNTLVTEDIEIRAMWRLDGGYYLLYNPEYYYDDNGTVTRILGHVEQWTDPENPSIEVYSDQAHTQILRAPTNIPENWVFRGWRIVKANGTSQYTDSEGTHTYTNWEPMELGSNGNPIYYQPGESFTIDSQYASENPQGGFGAIIHMQAYYEPVNTSFRRPDVTNLTLDANNAYGGYIDNAAGSLPTLDWTGSTDFNLPYQILFGDFQSNAAVHLYKYATTKEFNGVTGIQFFKNDGPYTLIGFDPNPDPEHPSTGSAFVPAYSPDSVIAVTRNDDVTLYAMWEPKIYVTFVNTTNKPITIDLSGTGTDTVRIVNTVTGEYDREEASKTIVVPANDQVKIVLPTASTDPNTADAFTATAVNDHIGKKMSVSGSFQGADHGTGSEDIPYNYPTNYTAPLKLDMDGITVTYTEETDARVIFDVNGGVWKETSTDYVKVDPDLEIYAIEADKIVNNDYEPTNPGHSDNSLVFIGWTTNADIAAHTDFTGTHDVTWGKTVITLEGNDTIMDKVRAEYLWDFSQEPPYDEVLYAVYSNCVTVTFDLLRETKNNRDYLHQWTGPATTDEDELYVFYRESPTSRYVTYKLLPGEKVPKPEDPTEDSAWPTASNPNVNHYFVAWLTVNSRINTAKEPNDSVIAKNTFNFDSAITNSETTLYTSWTTSAPQTFTFNVENHVVGGSPNEEFTYNVNVSRANVWGKRNGSGSNSHGPSDVDWGSIPLTLKNNENYTVIVTVKHLQASGWDACSVDVVAIDSAGNVVKNGQVTYANKNTNPYYVGSYQYSVSIDQAEKANYTTTVAVEDNPGSTTLDPIVCSVDQDNRKFLFDSRWRASNVSASQADWGVDENNNPLDVVNEYHSGEAKSLTVVFTNTNTNTTPVAPTDVRMASMPLLLMALFGAMLLGGAILAGRIRKRR